MKRSSLKRKTALKRTGFQRREQLDLQRRKRIKRVSKAQQKRLAWRKQRKLELWEEFSMDNPVAGLLMKCSLCGETIWEFEDCELDHKIPVRRGGDVDSNTHLVHALGNRAKLSTTLDKYLELPLEVRRKNCGVL